jgi:hypothetical protein
VAVELSLQLSGNAPHAPHGSFAQWALTASAAQEPCLVLRRDGTVAAVSPGCAELLAIDAVRAVDQRFVGEVVELLDFSAVPGRLPDWEVEKIPPLLAQTSQCLTRGLVRVRGERGPTTVDAISVPLRDGANVVGSLSFFAPVR